MKLSSLNKLKNKKIFVESFEQNDDGQFICARGKLVEVSEDRISVEIVDIKGESVGFENIKLYDIKTIRLSDVAEINTEA